MTQQLPKVPVPAGSNVSISCETDTANPLPIIEWSRNAAIVVETETYSVSESDREGEYNGKILISTLSFIVTHVDQEMEFSCGIMDDASVMPQKSTLVVEGMFG